jgi:hypothetical protein
MNLLDFQGSTELPEAAVAADAMVHLLLTQTLAGCYVSAYSLSDPEAFPYFSQARCLIILHPIFEGAPIPGSKTSIPGPQHSHLLRFWLCWFLRVGRLKLSQHFCS